MGNGHSQNYVLQNAYTYGYIPNVQLFGPGPNLFLILSKQLFSIMYMPIVIGPGPIRVQCPKCNQNTVTRLKYVNGSYTWMSCIAILILGCGIGVYETFKCAKVLLDLIWPCSIILAIIGFPFCFCSVLPFVLHICKDVEHYCGSCNNYIGKYFRGNRSPAIVLPPQQQQVNQNHPNDN
uniref:LITAF domain-containing protein n=1 Tax=Meloidogyne javanica TaxID=6303 RepID=A0A915M8N6_MELJA